MIKDQYIISCELMKDKIDTFEEYPFNLPFIKSFQKIDFHRNVTFLVGENGSGKSTLLEALAIQYGFNPEGGSKNFNFSTQATHSALVDFLRLAKGSQKAKDWYFLRAESFYNVASNIDDLQRVDGRMYKSYGGKSLHSQSHWESFFSLFMNRFYGEGVYMLDEPEAALSPQKQLSFLIRMHELVQQKSQFIIASHSPIILSYPHAEIIEISQDGFRKVSYKDTEHFQLYKFFLNNPESMLKQLNIE